MAPPFSNSHLSDTDPFHVSYRTTSDGEVPTPTRLNGMTVLFNKAVLVSPVYLAPNGKRHYRSRLHATSRLPLDSGQTNSIPIPHPLKASSAQPRRLSQSPLWQLQSQFFRRQGVKAWNRGTVPHYLTSNPFIANAYGKVVYGFLQDWYASNLNGDTLFPDPTQPIYIIELGADLGRFAYHFLKPFFASFRRSPLSTIPVKYVLTDFSDRNLDFWRSHPSLQPYFDQGLLDIAHFDLARDQQLTLEHSGERLTADTLETPLVVFANYVFDSIPQDLFSIGQGQLHETLVTVSSELELDDEPDLDTPHLLDGLEITYDDQPITPTGYYRDPAFNAVLAHYQNTIDNTSILFPITALRCLRNLRKLAGDRLLFLTGDKGHSRESDLLNQRPPSLVPHGNCFSLTVNYHAIGQYVSNQGGQVLQTPQRPSSLNILGFLFGHPLNGYGSTRLAYDEAIANHGPDDFYTLKKAVETHFEDFTLRQLLAYLRLSGWDSKIFLDSYSALQSKLDSVSDDLRAELYDAARQLSSTHYPIGETRNLAFHLGSLLYDIGYHSKALAYFQQALDQLGPTPDLHLRIALCHYRLRQLKPALKWINQALELEPTHTRARALRAKIQKKIRRAKSQGPMAAH